MMDPERDAFRDLAARLRDTEGDQTGVPKRARILIEFIRAVPSLSRFLQCNGHVISLGGERALFQLAFQYSPALSALAKGSRRNTTADALYVRKGWQFVGPWQQLLPVPAMLLVALGTGDGTLICLDDRGTLRGCELGAAMFTWEYQLPWSLLVPQLACVSGTRLVVPDQNGQLHTVDLDPFRVRLLAGSDDGPIERVTAVPNTGWVLSLGRTRVTLLDPTKETPIASVERPPDAPELVAGTAHLALLGRNVVHVFGLPGLHSEGCLKLSPACACFGQSGQLVIAQRDEKRAILAEVSDGKVRIAETRELPFSPRSVWPLTGYRYLSAVAESEDGVAWDSRTGAVDGWFRTNPFVAPATAPSGQFITWSDRALRVWNFGLAKSALSLSRIDVRGPASALCISAHESRLLTYHLKRKLVCQWDLDNGQLSYELDLSGRAPPNAYDAALDCSGQFCALLTNDGLAVVDVRSGNTVMSWPEATAPATWCFLGDATSLLIGHDGGTVEVRSTSTGKRLWGDSLGSRPRCVAFSPKGRYAAAVGGSGETIVWNAETGARVRQFMSTRHAAQSPILLDSVVIAPDSGTTMGVFSLEEPGLAPTPLRDAHRATVLRDSLLAIVGADRSVRMARPSDGLSLNVIGPSTDCPDPHIVSSGDGSAIAIVGDHLVDVWRTDPLEHVGRWAAPEHVGLVAVTNRGNLNIVDVLGDVWILDARESWDDTKSK